MKKKILLIEKFEFQRLLYFFFIVDLVYYFLLNYRQDDAYSLFFYEKEKWELASDLRFMTYIV